MRLFKYYFRNNLGKIKSYPAPAQVLFFLVVYEGSYGEIGRGRCVALFGMGVGGCSGLRSFTGYLGGPVLVWDREIRENLVKFYEVLRFS